jgi:hypothetical protein
MATPYDRKVVFSTYIIPEIIYEEELEEGTPKVYGTIYNVAEGGVGKALGAKSRGDEVQISHDQGSDTWTSEEQYGIYWDTVPDIHNWEDYGYILGDNPPKINGPRILRPSTGVYPGLQDTIFLWVRNVGEKKLRLSLDGGSTYPIKLESFASFVSRLNNIDSDLIVVDTDGEGESTVEYMVAF